MAGSDGGRDGGVVLDDDWEDVNDWEDAAEAPVPTRAAVAAPLEPSTPPVRAQPVAPHPRQVSVGEALGRGTLSGATFGFDEEGGGLVQSGLAKLANALPKGSLEWAGIDNRYQHDAGEVYRQARDEGRAEKDNAREQQPAAFFTGEIGGALLTTPLTGGAGNVRAGASAAGVVGNALLRRAGRAALSGGLQGALAGLGNSDADLTRDEYGRAVGDSTRAGVTGALLASTVLRGSEELAPRLARLADRLPDAMRRFAEERAVKAAGPVFRDVEQLSRAPGGVHGTGRALLDDAVVTADASLDDIAERSYNQAQRAVEGIDDGITQFDSLANRGERVRPALVAEDIQQQVARPRLQGPATGREAGNAAQAEADVLREMGGRDGAKGLSFFKAEQHRRALDRGINWKVPEWKGRNEALMEVRGVLDDAVTRQAEGISTRVGNPDLIRNWLASKQAYATYRPILDIAERRASRNLANRLVSPSDHAAGGIAALVRAEQGGNPVAAGLGGMVANHIARMRGNQLAAAGADFVADAADGLVPTFAGRTVQGLAQLPASAAVAAERAPLLAVPVQRASNAEDAAEERTWLRGLPELAATAPEALGPYGPLFQRAAQEGDDAVLALDQALLAEDEGYRRERQRARNFMRARTRAAAGAGQAGAP